MSKMRHKKAGGSIGNDMDGESESKGSKKVKAYDGGDSDVEKEADEKKHGGRVKKADGGKVEGDKPKMRMDRAKRKSGGRVGGMGSDKSPFSSAHKVSPVKEHSTEDV